MVGWIPQTVVLHIVQTWNIAVELLKYLFAPRISYRFVTPLHHGILCISIYVGTYVCNIYACMHVCNMYV